MFWKINRISWQWKGKRTYKKNKNDNFYKILKIFWIDCSAKNDTNLIIKKNCIYKQIKTIPKKWIANSFLCFGILIDINDKGWMKIDKYWFQLTSMSYIGKWITKLRSANETYLILDRWKKWFFREQMSGKLPIFGETCLGLFSLLQLFMRFLMINFPQIW